MRLERLYHSARLLLLRSSIKRAEYIKKHDLFDSIGENCHWGPALLPLYSKLIRLHDNVTVHKKAYIMPHDLINGFLMRSKPGLDLVTRERLGCIELMDNVYVGINAMIMPDVRINKNCIVSAGSVVTADVPENSVVAGNPAQVIGRFDIYMAMRRMNRKNYVKFKNQELPDALIQPQWMAFEARRK